ncbi:unnamed protein product [Coffea canephora]|uniref:DH200=94 genomic scaffold, scaffold_801 n=1 Tax=Coffea canephora TaxID=49390 RepID=A0A068VH91_COFCA|nr:unnamed protein product [Coffea canephora]
MAESVAGLLINQLSTLLSQEITLLGGLKSDVQFIKDELESMKAFLGEAEAKEGNDSQLRAWLKQVRERYQSLYGTQERGFSSSRLVNADFDFRVQSLFIEEAQLVGIAKPKAELISKILDDHSQLKVVSVVGMGGLGKTTLVKKVYDDAAVKKQFQSHAWITVSQNFQFSDIIKNLIQQLYNEIRRPVPPEVESMNDIMLSEFVRDFLREKRYILVLDDVGEILDLQHSVSPKLEFLTLLFLKGRLERVPQWVTSLHSLRILWLANSRLREDENVIGSLRHLPNLVSLGLYVAYEGETICFKVGGFRKLQRLQLMQLTRLKWVRVEEGSMPSLRSLRLGACKLMQELPSGIQNLTRLEYLGFYEMSDELVHKVQNLDKQSEDYQTISHIPQVAIGHWIDGRWEGTFL